MDWATTLVTLGVGLGLLVAGGELLVRGASSVATAFGISPLVIGLTVVAFGTSSPELAVSIQAGLAGNPDIAMGNVVGSNIFNVLFILGACALILPLLVSRQLVRREVPIMIGVSFLLLLLALDGRVGPLDGALLFAGIVGYTAWSIVESRRETAAQAGAEGVTVDTLAAKRPAWLGGAVAALALAGAGYALGWLDAVAAGLIAAGALLFIGGSLFGKGGATRGGDIAHQVGLIFAGLGTLVLGAGWLIDSATTIARAFGVSDLIIGLTIVAAGTSLPEVATSIIATLRKERDIAIGNVVGSNIFNLLGILGLAALVTPGGLNVNPLMLSFDLPIMIAVAAACLPIFFTGFTIARWEGVLFLGSYVAYTAFLVLVATRNPALETFTNAMLLVLPLIAATLVWTGVQALRRQRGPGAGRR
ncbi:MAG TPA: calcium/sodium antiporter [Chloroflexaceae bacterium]|nr:calcium/sodium antiporter [Chloroflexaceae bacterium]